VHRALLERRQDQRADLTPADEGAAAAPAEEIGEVELLATDSLAEVSVKVAAQLGPELPADIEVILVPTLVAVAGSCVFEHLW
jgi:hypothetical protein